MTMRMGSVVVAAVVGLLVSGGAYAGAPDGGIAKPTPPAHRDPGALREARGKVHDIDKQKNQVTLDGRQDKPLTLQVDKTTTIFIDGRTGTLDEIAAGADVRASYEHREGANRAQWIEVNKKLRKPSEAREPLPEAPTPASSSPAPGDAQGPK